MTKRVCIIGAAGRMGGALQQAIGELPSLALAAAVDREDDLGQALTGVDVAIDFSNAAATTEHVQACVRARVPLLIGTTGLDEATQRQIDLAAVTIPVLVAANTSLALNVLVEVVRQAAAALPAGFDIEIFEAHHRHKVDAPSGTALALADAAAAGRKSALEHQSGSRRGPRQPGSLGFSVMRGGDVVGEHEVRLLGTGEQLRLGHVATDRAIFARGALAAATWLAGQPAGRYQMSDFLFTKQ